MDKCSVCGTAFRKGEATLCGDHGEQHLNPYDCLSARTRRCAEICEERSREWNATGAAHQRIGNFETAYRHARIADEDARIAALLRGEFPEAFKEGEGR
jgi:hypothetical protein